MLVILMALLSAFLVASQVFLKYHVIRNPLPSPMAAQHIGAVLWDALSSGYLWLFCVFIFLAGLLWMYVLNNWPLSIAYPMISFAYVFMVLASWLMFNEPITWPKLAGTGFVCVGVALLSR